VEMQKEIKELIDLKIQTSFNKPSKEKLFFINFT